MIRIFVFLYLAFAVGPVASTGNSAAVEPARQTIIEWVQTQRILSEERTGWREEEQVLRQSIGLLEEELRRIRGRLDAFDAASDRTGEKRGALGAENEALLAASAEGGGLLSVLEEELEALRPMFPLPLESRAAPLFDRLGEVRDGNSVATGQRLQTVLGILAELNAFQRTVTLSRETRPLPDGTLREVQTIYLGLAQAYFVDDQKRVAGVGRPTPGGWEWTRDDELAAAIARTVNVLENRSTAEFVNLPIEIRSR